MRLQNKIALITGGNSGIGYATAKRFLEEGAQVIITGRNEQSLREAATQLGSDRITAIKADAAKPAEIQSAFDQVKATFGHLDILFLNA